MTNTPIVDAVAYDRHSTKLQDGAVREKAIRDFSIKENFLLKEFYLDAGISGKKKSRPALDRMLADVRSGKVKTIVLYKLDRLGRSLPNLLDLLQEFRNRKVRVISVVDGIDTDRDDPMSRAFVQMLGVFAELEAEIIGERTTEGREYAWANGKQKGRPRGAKDRVERSKSGYWLRYAGKTVEQRKLGKRADKDCKVAPCEQAELQLAANL